MKISKLLWIVLAVVCVTAIGLICYSLGQHSGVRYIDAELAILIKVHNKDHPQSSLPDLEVLLVERIIDYKNAKHNFLARQLFLPKEEDNAGLKRRLLLATQICEEAGLHIPTDDR